VSSSTSRPAIPLRARNATTLKLEIVRLVREKLRTDNLESIVVKPLCQELGIAPATFFNHFPGKTDVLIYFIQLWTVRLEFLSLEKCGHEAGMRFLEALFAVFAEDVEEHPRLMQEIISYIATAESRPEFRPIGKVDLLLAWPQLNGVEELEVRDVGDVMREHISVIYQGKKNSTRLEESLFESLVSLFYGYPMTAKVLQISDISKGLRRQLETVWQGHQLGK